MSGPARRGPGTRPAALAALLAVVAWVAPSGCAPDAPPPTPLTRADRFGVLRELMLYRRAGSRGGAFFLDRFETTRGDYWRYMTASAPAGAALDRLAAPWGVGPPAEGTEHLPVVAVDLRASRRYARWRLCRLPRLDEWESAVAGGDRYVNPWGDQVRPERVNCWEVGLDGPTPVGSFESGREVGGAYDLLGNVAEWTETVREDWLRPPAAAGAKGPTLREGTYRLARTKVLGIPGMRLWALPRMPLPWSWLRRTVPEGSVESDASSGGDEPFLNADARLLSTPALQPWRLGAVPAPGYWLIEAFSSELPRYVAGGHFRTVMFSRGADPRVWPRAPRERGDTLGLRLATDPLGILARLAEHAETPSEAEIRAVRAFVRDPRNRPELAPVLPAALSRVARPGPLAAVLREELGE